MAECFSRQNVQDTVWAEDPPRIDKMRVDIAKVTALRDNPF